MRISLKTQLLCVIAVTVIVAVAITGVLMYSQLNSIMQEQIRENLANVMRENSLNINNTLSYIYRAEKALNTNEHFKSLLTEESGNVIEKANRIVEISNELKTTYGLIIDESTNDYSMCFIVNDALPVATNLSDFQGDDFGGKNNGIYRDRNIKNLAWYEDVLSSAGMPKSFRNAKNPNYIYFANVIKNVSPYDSQLLGVVTIGINFNRILENITYMGVKDALQLAVIDRTGEIAVSTGEGINEENVSALLSGRTEYNGNLVLVSELDYGMSLVALLDETEASIRIRKVENYLWLCLALVSVAVLLCSVLISTGITRPIKTLSDTMKMVNENQDIQIKTKLPSSEEVASLYQSYNRMMFRISQLLDEAKLSGEREEAMRMKMLQAQINPHYLYNALDSISMVALLRGENEISEMITILSDSFRYSISDTDNLIELGDEISFIHNYVKFQEWRYEEKIFFEAELNESHLKIAIPKFIIQPLVENAIIHGMGDEDRAIHIKITAKSTPETFVIYVIDDGAGCDIKELNLHLASGGSERYALKFGLKNVNERIKLKFGDKYGLYYTDTPGGGTTAKITLPPADATVRKETNHEAL